MDKNKFLKYCLDNLDFDQPDQFEEYLSCVPLCAINSIYSINTKYEAVLNVMNRCGIYFNIPAYHTPKGKIPDKKNQKTVSEIYDILKDLNPKILANDIFQNRQLTSTKNGILKADASLKFIRILKDFGIETYQDINKLNCNETFEECIKRIPGQKSGISLKYFFMLTGTKDQIKPDRMVIGFIKDATGLTVSHNDALVLIRWTVEELIKNGYKKLSPRHLDNLIWNYQR